MKTRRRRSFPGQCTVFKHAGPDGAVLEVRSTPLPDGSFVQTFTDITKRAEAEAHVTRLASEDPLTGLPNRRVFRSAIEKMSRRDRAAGERHCQNGFRRAVSRSRSLQGHQRHARPSHRRHAADRGGAAAEAVAAADATCWRGSAATNSPSCCRRSNPAPRSKRWRMRSSRRSASPTRSTVTACAPASASASRSDRTTATTPTIC